MLSVNDTVIIIPVLFDLPYFGKSFFHHFLGKIHGKVIQDPAFRQFHAFIVK